MGKRNFNVAFQKPSIFRILSSISVYALVWFVMFTRIRIFLVTAIVSLCWIVSCNVFVCGNVVRYFLD